MAHRTLTRADLLQTASVSGPPGLTRSEAKDLVEATLETICSALVNNETVKLRGFGTFNLRSKRPRVGRNPKTGNEYPITARRVLTFRPSPRLIAAINGEVFEGEGEDDEPTPQKVRRAAPAALDKRTADIGK